MTLEHWARFRPEELLVEELQHWLIVVRSKQITLGACVLLLRRPEERLSGLAPAEAAEFPAVVGAFERRALAAFHPEKFNYVAAMMKDPYVHFHALPRYSVEQQRYGQRWRDQAWPKAISLSDVSTSDDVLFGVRADLAGSPS